MKKLACLTLLAALAATTPAHADSCGGDLISYKKLVNDKGTTIGQLQFYFNNDNGNNCGILKHSDATWGTKLPTGIFVGECTNRACTNLAADGNGDDSGNFAYEAGPVRQYGRTPGGKPKCMGARGQMTYKGESVVVFTGPHCG